MIGYLCNQQEGDKKQGLSVRFSFCVGKVLLPPRGMFFQCVCHHQLFLLAIVFLWQPEAEGCTINSSIQRLCVERRQTLCNTFMAKDTIIHPIPICSWFYGSFVCWRMLLIERLWHRQLTTIPFVGSRQNNLSSPEFKFVQSPSITRKTHFI